MSLHPYLDKFPRIHPTAFVEETARIIGDVEIGPRSSVWFNAVIRGDVHFIRIGQDSNVQDLACLHVTHDTCPLIIGDRTSIAHGVQLHGCTIGNDCLIAIGAIVLDNAIIGDHCLVGAGALITPRTVIPPNSFVLGSPAKVIRTLTDREILEIHQNAQNYIRYGENHRRSVAGKTPLPYSDTEERHP